MHGLLGVGVWSEGMAETTSKLTASPYCGFKYKTVDKDLDRTCESCGQQIEDNELYPVCPFFRENWDEERGDQCLSVRNGKYTCSACNTKFVRVELNGKEGFVSR